MTLSELAHRHQPVVVILLAVAMVFGLVAMVSLPAREDPAVTIREAVIVTDHPGLSAEKVEALITRPIEESVRQVGEVEQIRSVSRTGRSTLHVEIHDRYFDLDQIWDEVRVRVAEIRPDLPEGTREPIINDDVGDVAVVTAALTGPDYTMAELFDIAEHVRDRLYGVLGTKRVEILGAQPERIFIETDNVRLARLGIDPETLIATLRAHNIIRPGGEIDTGGRGFILRPTGDFDSVTAIADTLIPVGRDGTQVPLRDLARVNRGLADPPARKAYVNGVPALVFAIAMGDDADVREFGARVRDRLASLAATLPVGLGLDIITFQPDQVDRAVAGVGFNLIQTLVIVSAVVVVFLGLRTGLIVGATIPAVVLITLAIMAAAGLELERMSLATLIIALGILVDNGIVVAEDFKRRLESGASRDSALRDVGAELTFPLLASTLTTILVFLPLMMADHVAGEYTRSISLVILISLGTSWVLALTVTPLLAHRFIRPSEAGRRSLTGPAFDRLARIYRRVLVGVLRRRGVFLLAMIALLAGAVLALQQVPKRFFPASDRPQILVYADLPAGVTSRTTDARLRDMMTIVGDRDAFPHFRDFAAYMGFGGPRFVLSLAPIDPAPNRAFMVINVDDPAQLAPGIAALRRAFHQRLPGVRVRVTDMFLGPSDSSEIEIQAKGPDPEVLMAAADRIAARLADLPGAIDIRRDWDNRITRLAVRVDQARARRAGISAADIAATLDTFLSGRVVSRFRDGDDVFPIMVRGPADERGDPDRLRGLVLHGAKGPVVLDQVADLVPENTWSTIAREDLERTVTVAGRNTLMTAEDMVPRLASALDALAAELPPGHTIEFDGVVVEGAQGRAALLANLPFVIGVILVLLVAQFNGFRRPAIVLGIIPLLIIGAALGLTVLGANFGFMVILGLFALAGIIVNNAIVLLDRIAIEGRQHGADPYQAVVTACVLRLRPILMTTLTTILGLLPLMIDRDPLFYGMAGVIAFGLGVGTLLTLGVVPVLYTLFYRIPIPREPG